MPHFSSTLYWRTDNRGIAPLPGLKVVSYYPVQGLLVVNRFRFASCPMSSSFELPQMDAKRPVSVTSQMSPFGRLLTTGQVKIPVKSDLRSLMKAKPYVSTRHAIAMWLVLMAWPSVLFQLDTGLFDDFCPPIQIVPNQCP
jgi:hypothetical protein